MHLQAGVQLQRLTMKLGGPAIVKLLEAATELLPPAPRLSFVSGPSSNSSSIVSPEPGALASLTPTTASPTELVIPEAPLVNPVVVRGSGRGHKDRGITGEFQGKSFTRKRRQKRREGKGGALDDIDDASGQPSGKKAKKTSRAIVTPEAASGGTAGSGKAGKKNTGGRLDAVKVAARLSVPTTSPTSPGAPPTRQHKGTSLGTPVFRRPPRNLDGNWDNVTPEVRVSSSGRIIRRLVKRG